jgi:molybdopterin-biosynthesis enzyme MoeA-like protein
MKATIITIGDEILIGQIVILILVIAKSLDKIGVEINEISIVIIKTIF